MSLLQLLEGFVNALMNGYRMFYFGMFLMLAIQTFSDWMGMYNLVNGIFLVTLGLQVYLVILYFVLVFTLRNQTLIFGDKQRLQGIKLWKVTAFWEHFKDNIIKDIALWNGLINGLAAVYLLKVGA